MIMCSVAELLWTWHFLSVLCSNMHTQPEFSFPRCWKVFCKFHRLWS